jgi:hypothetical protein
MPNEMVHAPSRAEQGAPTVSWHLLQRLYDVAQAARTYFDGYCQDEAADDGPDFTGCSDEQHRDAKALKAALAEYSPDETLRAIQLAASVERAS